ncbi:MAG: protein-glutamate O-methyltransferase CheR [Clostridiaceae bacterium]|nr:protein-glutamate O-methyltransferase CheR [Clostridiaceae bacterium]
METFQDYELFKSKFFAVSTIDLNLYKERQMKRRITSFASKYGFTTYCSFLDEIIKNKELFDKFVNYLTINVSEFYRNPKQWEVLSNEILPEIAKVKNLADLKIWSSACSTGDEPYTVAMILNEFIPLRQIRVLATDKDLDAINKAKEGIYPSRSVKELPKRFLDKHFTKIDEDNYQISQDVKNCVEFRKLNLLLDPYPQNVDIIICRNVLIYFTEEAKDMVYEKFSKSLAKDGILFIGSTEQIINYHKYNLKPIGTFFYKKVEG